MSALSNVSNNGIGSLPGQAQAVAAPTLARKPAQPNRDNAEFLPAPGANQPLQASYEYNEALRQVVITLLNPETGAVVREIPGERVIQVAEALLRTVNETLNDQA